MAKTRKSEQHIAVFGESGSGKTVLISSFFGALKEPPYTEDHLFQVVADDIGQGHHLLQNYYKMSNSAQVPQANRFRAVPYRFSLKLRDASSSKTQAAAHLGALSLVWHDYPGEWFEQSVSGPEEAERRVETFRSLLGSDVALLLVDGQKLKENSGQEERYLKALFSNFSNGLLTLKDDLLSDGKPLVEFPRIWMIALSKSDLLPHMTASDFKVLVIEKAAENLAVLRETIAGLVASEEALSVGEDFIILSSAKFEDNKIEVHERVGLDLILPTACVLPFERHVRWAHKREISGNVADNLLGKADALGARALTVALLGAKAVKLPGPFIAISAVVGTLVTRESMTEAANLVGEKLREVNTRALEKKQTLTAILTQFKIDLEKGEEIDVLRRSER